MNRNWGSDFIRQRLKLLIFFLLHREIYEVLVLYGIFLGWLYPPISLDGPVSIACLGNYCVRKGVSFEAGWSCRYVIT